MKPRLVKLPSHAEIPLYLIREELKSRKLFQALHEAGIDDCYFQPHLDELILSLMEIDNVNDEIFLLYDRILEKRSRKIEADNDSIMNQALKVYRDLLHIKKSNAHRH